MAGKRRFNRLSARLVDTAAIPGRYGDGHGLYLYVKPSGSKSWVQRLAIHGRTRDLGLGGYPMVSLAEARHAAFDNRKLARAGGDPLALKRRADVPTFETAAATVIKLHSPGWRNAKHTAQWGATLRAYAFPRVGKLSVAAITTADVMAVLIPIWHEKPETARRVRQRVSTVLKWAVAQGYRQDNPAGDAIGAALPRHNGNGKRHHRALPHGAVADAIEAVRASDAGIATKLAFEFLILTAARSGEVRHAEWSEIDMEGAVWTIPAERTKAGREHRVPLSARSQAILAAARAVADESGLIFPSPLHAGKPLSENTLTKLMCDLGMDAVAHGFRTSFRTWCAEMTNTPRAVAEAALAHAVRDKVEAAYNRTDLFERRRRLMDQWAAYLESGGERVVPMVRQSNA